MSEARERPTALELRHAHEERLGRRDALRWLATKAGRESLVCEPVLMLEVPIHDKTFRWAASYEWSDVAVSDWRDAYPSKPHGDFTRAYFRGYLTVCDGFEPALVCESLSCPKARGLLPGRAVPPGSAYYARSRGLDR